MRILMFGMSSYPGGIENYIANYFLCEEISKDITIDFVTYETKLAYLENIEKCGYTIQFVPHLKKNPIGYIRAVNRLLKTNHYDCVYVNMLSAANIQPLRSAIKHKVPKIVAHAHANATIKGFVRKFLHKVNKKYCKEKANYKFACSKEAGEWLFDKQKCIIVPNAIDRERFAFNQQSRKEIRDKYGIEENCFLVGHVGRFAEEKNHTFLIDVFACLIRKKFNAKLMLVGDGSCRLQIQEKVDRLGLAEKVVFVGTSAETEKYYSAFDCFVFPSIFEGFGMATLEAQVSGLKCFCSDCLSEELKVMENMVFLPLNFDAEKWSDEIMQAQYSDKRLMKNFPVEYDIREQRKKILEILR